jgi:hypothetical protein
MAQRKPRFDAGVFESCRPTFIELTATSARAHRRPERLSDPTYAVQDRRWSPVEISSRSISPFATGKATLLRSQASPGFRSGLIYMRGDLAFPEFLPEFQP